MVYDRINTVQTVIIPTLGVGFAQTLQTGAAKNAAGLPFRVGVDGSIPIPTLAPVTPPNRSAREHRLRGPVVRRGSLYQNAEEPHD